MFTQTRGGLRNFGGASRNTDAGWEYGINEKNNLSRNRVTKDA